jgi:hypothetical protein
MLERVPGVEIVARHRLNESGNAETDIWLRHRPSVSDLPFSDQLLPAE